MGLLVVLLLILAAVTTLTRTDSAGSLAAEGEADAGTRAAPAWVAALGREVERIDAAMSGELGVYVKRLPDGGVLLHPAGGRTTPWYLASSAKLPVAIAVLREVEAGRLALDTELTLEATDKVDGAGNLMWQEPGSPYTVDVLLERMLMESDNTAANLLMRRLGDDVLNRHVRELLGNDGVGRFINFVEVRRRVYAQLHPSAAELSNDDLVKVAAAPLGPQRVEAVRRTLGVDEAELLVPTLDQAYARYYESHVNEAPLPAYGRMLERLVRGELLSPEHTQLLFKRLKFDTYDAYRLEAGLPRSERFIHKTGTQFERACHMGVVNPQDGGADAIVVATCAKGLDEHDEAGQAFEQVGRAITKVMLKP